MKNWYIFLFLIVAAIASAVYFFKDELFSGKPVSSWNFVPETAAGVWEFEDPIDDWNKFLATDHWKNLSQLPFFRNINESLIRIDSLTGKSGLIANALKTGNFLISAHNVSSTSFDFVYFLKVESVNYQEEFLRLTDHYRNDDRYSFSERNYRGQIITEIKENTPGSSFTYILYKNHLIGSFTPFLVEDVIRTIQGENQDFKSASSKAFGLASLKYDAGNIYINLGRLSAFYALFFENKNLPFNTFLKTLKGSGFLDIEFDESYFFLNGFIIPDSDSSYLRIFKNQQPVASDFSQLIPENAAFIFYQSFSDASAWHSGLRKIWRIYGTTENDALSSFIKKYDFDLERTLSWMSGQIVQIWPEPVDIHTSKLLLLGTTDVYDALNQLNKLAGKVNEQAGDTLYYENYGQHIINLLNISEFPENIFGRWYGGYPQTYYTVIENFMVMSDDIETIKELLNNREDECTWKQSVSKTVFLNHNLEESIIGLFINTPKAWNLVRDELNGSWQKPWREYSRSLKHMELIGLQLSRTTGRKFYTSIVIKQRKPIEIAQQGQDKIEKILAVAMDTTIGLKPKVVRNHRNGSLEILVQDISNHLYLVDINGNILWKDSLDGQVIDRIYQIDFYKNKKLQYLLATDSLLYIIDRNGKAISGYPVEITGIDMDRLSVVDYNRTRNYRFMLKEQKGDVYLLDKEGNRLEGWNPKSYGRRFSVSPFHLRVRSRDVFIAISENGIVHATNRRGEMLPGFPLDLGTGVSGDIFYQIKSGFNKTFLTVVTGEGEIIQFNLEGEVKNRLQLYKPSRDTKFRLVKENLGRSYVIARQDLNRLAIVDKDDRLLMEKDYLTQQEQEFDVQYYNFGAGRELIFVQGAEQEKVLMYDNMGNLKSASLKSALPVSVIYYESKEKYHIYTALSDSLFVYTVHE